MMYVDESITHHLTPSFNVCCGCPRYVTTERFCVTAIWRQFCCSIFIPLKSLGIRASCEEEAGEHSQDLSWEPPARVHIRSAIYPVTPSIPHMRPPLIG